MSWLRHPKTTQERRANQDGYARKKRCLHHLPSAWDDIGRSDWRDRSWKRHRKTQYKVVDKFERKKKDSSKYAKSMAKRDHFCLDHKRCSWKWGRCAYCIKHGIWNEYDKYLTRCHRRFLESQGHKYVFWWQVVNEFKNDGENNG